MTEDRRRRGPRYTFVASAELLELSTDTRLATRISELSKHGCYLDMMNPFPVGSIIMVKISAGNALFQSKAQIIYAHPNLGAGVAFLETDPQQEKIIEEWIQDAAKDPDRVLK